MIRSTFKRFLTPKTEILESWPPISAYPHRDLMLIFLCNPNILRVVNCQLVRGKTTTASAYKSPADHVTGEYGEKSPCKLMSTCIRIGEPTYPVGEKLYYYIVGLQMPLQTGLLLVEAIGCGCRYIRRRLLIKIR